MPKIVVNKNENNKSIFLSFDDGPHPDTSLKILKLLEKYQAKASFFLLGEMVLKHKKLFEEIKKQSHSIGTHGMRHRYQPVFCTKTYIREIEESAEIIGTKLFRPPYGFITPRVYRKLKNKFEIVLWDVMPGDFKRNKSLDDMIKTVIKNTKNGSIIVLHEGKENFETTLILTERILEYYSNLGYKFLGL